MCKWGDTTEIKLAHPGKRGLDMASVDRCIAPIVQALNDAGIQTIASCCGHGHINGTIALEDGRWLELYSDRVTFQQESPAMNSSVDIHGIQKPEQEIDLSAPVQPMGIIEALFGSKKPGI